MAPIIEYLISKSKPAANRKLASTKDLKATLESIRYNGFEELDKKGYAYRQNIIAAMEHRNPCYILDECHKDSLGLSILVVSDGKECAGGMMYKNGISNGDINFFYGFHDQTYSVMRGKDAEQNILDKIINKH